MDESLFSSLPGEQELDCWLDRHAKAPMKHSLSEPNAVHFLRTPRLNKLLRLTPRTAYPLRSISDVTLSAAAKAFAVRGVDLKSTPPEHGG